MVKIFLRFLGLVFSLTAWSVYPCPRLSPPQAQQVTAEWRLLSQKFGKPVRQLHPPRICVAAEKFHEIPRGKTMRSVYDRSSDTIYLRRWELPALRHELAHAWLERKYPRLPYSVSENLVLCMLVLPGLAQQDTERQQIRHFLLSAPAGRCSDQAAASSALHLTPAELRSVLQGN